MSCYDKINSKSDINAVLSKNLDELACYMQKEICNQECFSKEQQYVLDDLCRNIFYYLTDIKDAINLLNK